MGLLNKAERNDKTAVRDALYAYFEKYLDPETHPPPDLMLMSAFGGKADTSRTYSDLARRKHSPHSWI
jgi:hypothetical protein